MAGGSYWKSSWWVTAISSYLTADGTRGSATTRQQRDNDNNDNETTIFCRGSSPTHPRMENISRSGTPLTLNKLFDKSCIGSLLGAKMRINTAFGRQRGQNHVLAGVVGAERAST